MASLAEAPARGGNILFVPQLPGDIVVLSRPGRLSAQARREEVLMPWIEARLPQNPVAGPWA